MSAKDDSSLKTNSWRLSLDSWAVVVALLAALLLRVGVFKHVPW